MLAKQITRLADVLVEKGISKSEDREIVIYGLTAGVELVFNIITTIALGFLFGLVLESVIFLISFSFIRTFAGGFHCKKAINCYFMSSGIVVLALFIIKFLPEQYVVIAGAAMLIVSIPVLLALAPIETPTKPLDNEEKCYYRKKFIDNLIIEFAVILILVVVGFKNIALSVCLGIAVSAALVALQKVIRKQQ